eukprot:CAMPEP_0185905832 /NCGR_PEP_ID=MMETSP0196C-20130402/4999_1 /TAXON_ID=2932 /ORGANISM="Alexandrium fundyense, Strain CCMP1719" /LENGTH=40 /DNA_ID= /DNA_START= /DNA_END= /DNA_ORIENTATION=
MPSTVCPGFSSDTRNLPSPSSATAASAGASATSSAAASLV